MALNYWSVRMAPTSRRSVLQILAASAVAGAVGGCRAEGLPDPAAAWRNPGAGETDPRRFALAHAILAPNPHNRQPWLIALPGADEIALYFDTSRRLPATDPFDRQLTIGCGCFLELLAIAASARGLRAHVTPFPEGVDEAALDQQPVAHVRLAPGAEPDPLFGHIEARRSHREPFEARPLTARDFQAILSTARTASPAEGAVRLEGAGVGEPRAEEVRKLMPAAFRREMHTPAPHQESIALMRIGKREIARHRDGINLDFPGVEALRAVGLLTHETLTTPGSFAFEQGLSLYDPLAKTAAGFVWITTAPGRLQELTAGRLYARMNLQATAQGVAMHPISQALQEYEAMAELKAQMEAAVGLEPGHCLQMLARVGYAKPIPPAPRRGLQEHLL